MTDQITITASATTGLQVTVGGQPAQLAVVLADGTVVAAGPDVARGAEQAAQDSLRQFWRGAGHLAITTHVPA